MREQTRQKSLCAVSRAECQSGYRPSVNQEGPRCLVAQDATRPGFLLHSSQHYLRAPTIAAHVCPGCDDVASCTRLAAAQAGFGQSDAPSGGAQRAGSGLPAGVVRGIRRQGHQRRHCGAPRRDSSLTRDKRPAVGWPAMTRSPALRRYDAEFAQQVRTYLGPLYPAALRMTRNPASVTWPSGRPTGRGSTLTPCGLALSSEHRRCREDQPGEARTTHPRSRDRRSRSAGDSVNRFVNETQRDRLRQGRCARPQATDDRTSVEVSPHARDRLRRRRRKSYGS